MVKYYDIGNMQFKLESAGLGDYFLTEYDTEGKYPTMKHRLSLAEAYEEMVSFAEMDKDDWKGDNHGKD